MKLCQKNFQLWLEWEHIVPFENPKNDFANIGVDTLDGRHYGINVWTFQFLQTIQQEEKGRYVVPPDLLVEELSRGCVEACIQELLSKGALEEQLNPSVFGLKFLEPYQWEIEEEQEQALLAELALELPKGHSLKNQKLDFLLAKRIDKEEIVLALENGSMAVVHLTWKGKVEQAGYPKTRIYNTEKEFWQKEMRQVIEEYQK